jgi:uncharacterized membrane protein YjdF
MSKITISVLSIFSAVLLLGLHLWGMDSDLYVRFWYYDVILHILGGIAIALSIYTVGIFSNVNWLKNFFVVVLLSLVAGIAWEVFEIYFDITGFHIGTREYNMDTFKDLFNDTLGAVAIMLFIKK